MELKYDRVSVGHGNTFAIILPMLFTVLVGYLTWSLVAMELNYRRAKSMGIPLVRLPIDPLNVLWAVLETPTWRVLDLLPFDWGTFTLYSRRGWNFKDKSASHMRFGPIWALVTPRSIWVSVADPDAINDIYKRRTDFLRPNEFYSKSLSSCKYLPELKPSPAMLEVYGPCISTASWTEWPRHRKVLAAPFNESIMTPVWDESVKQTTQMLETWSANDGNIISYSNDMRRLSLNVLAATGFNRSRNFARTGSGSGVDDTASYRDALQIVLDNIITVMIVPPSLLLLPMVPKSWKRIGTAVNDFKEYMLDLLHEETRLFDQGKHDRGGLMAGFLRASRGSNTPSQLPQLAAYGTQRSKYTLSNDEILGDTFTIMFAGFDTTATTLASAILILSAHPEVQTWLSEEIAYVNKLCSKRELWEYAEVFPRLKRCRALMLETLRLFPPIMAIPKRTNSNPQFIRVGERMVTLPPNTLITPGPLAIQTLPEYWDQPLEWRPRRWISTKISSSSPNSPSLPMNSFDDEELLTPRPGTYLPWSDGPQNCPGLKFSQVEFVAIIATLFQQHRISVVLNSGETIEQGCQRAMATSQDCEMVMLLKLKNPDSVRLRCTVAA